MRTLLLLVVLVPLGVLAQQASSDPPSMRLIGGVTHAGDRPPIHPGPTFRGTAPINDHCSSVTPQLLSAWGTLTFTGDNTGATMDDDYIPGGLLEWNDLPSVWHAFTTTECADVTVSYCGTTPAFLQFWVVLVTECPGTDELIYHYSHDTTTCGDGNATIWYPELPAGTYYLPVLLDTDPETLSEGPYTIQVSAVPCVIPVPNEDCASVTALPVGAWCDYAIFPAGNSESLPAAACSGFTGNANDDAWFSFVATAPEMSISAIGTDDGDGNDLTGYDAVIELFDSCGGPSLACVDGTLSAEPETIEAADLTVGATYYFRVYNFYTAVPSPNTFGVCVIEGLGIGVHEVEQAMALQAFPNPGAGIFTLTYPEQPAVGELEVRDLSGKFVLCERLPQWSQVHRVELRNQAAGLYNCRMNWGTLTRSVRLVVEQ